jgi:membrane associated rhomboid family serine protease
MAVINLASFVSSIPVATRFMTAALLAFSLVLLLLRLTLTEAGVHYISFSQDDSAVAFPWLVIVPGNSFWFPWTLVTSAFCETSLFEFLISIVSLPLAGRYLERMWGPMELIRFSLIVIVSSNIVAWFIATALFAVVRSEKLFYGVQYHGLEALQTGFLVALAQLIPEHQVHFKFGLKFRVRDLPMAYVTFSNVACIVGYTSPFILIQFGWLSSWAYLRFFKLNDSGVRGDRSETFSLVSWFPPFMHKPVTFVSNTLYGIFLRLGVVQPWQYSAMGDVELGIGSGLPSMSVGVNPHANGGVGGSVSGDRGVNRAEAERRRTMALKALDQRVKTGSAVPPSMQAGPSPAAMSQQARDTSRPNGKVSVPRVVVQEASEEGGSPREEHAASSNANVAPNHSAPASNGSAITQ